MQLESIIRLSLIESRAVSSDFHQKSNRPVKISRNRSYPNDLCREIREKDDRIRSKPDGFGSSLSMIRFIISLTCINLSIIEDMETSGSERARLKGRGRVWNSGRSVSVFRPV